MATCKNVQNIGAIDCIERGFESCISTTYDHSLNDVNCTFCGQCIEACPTGALHEKENINDVWAKLKDPDTYVVVQTAPSVRVALGEEFKMEIGTNVTGKMVSALKRLGFDKVFDTNTGADFTIMEEATEFVKRFKENDNLPMTTSCCPGWVRFAEMEYPENLSHLSSCKSPHQMFGAIIKSYYAEKNNIDPKNIYVVSVMPCIAKKFERQREEMKVNGLWDVDSVITTRELARMIKQANIEFDKLEDETFDSPMGEATGAAAIFGVTGGVMEAALRSAYFLLKGENPPADAFRSVRAEGFNANHGVQEADFQIDDITVRTAVVSGLGNTRALLNKIEKGEVHYDFVEVMACPGGCVGGGGQPIHDGEELAFERGKNLYQLDESANLRYSHENPDINLLYEEYFEKPNSHKAHMLLHTDHLESMELYGTGYCDYSKK